MDPHAGKCLGGRSLHLVDPGIHVGLGKTHAAVCVDVGLVVSLGVDKYGQADAEYPMISEVIVGFDIPLHLLRLVCSNDVLALNELLSMKRERAAQYSFNMVQCRRSRDLE